MPADDRETPLPSGWLPPRAPAPGVPDPPPAPLPSRSWPRDPAQRADPSSPAVVFAIVIGAVSILLLGISAGAAFAVSMVLSAVALLIATRLRRAIHVGGRPGRESQARAAVIVAWVGLGLAVVAGIVWIVLAANGITPQDLQESLERQLERQRNRG